jgi:hypothetical protein
MRICVIGAIGPHKGYGILLACAEDAAARDLPLDFVIVGYSTDDAALFATGRVFVTGRYQEDEAVALVRRQGADYAFVPSVCPETWCYAISVAWDAGLQVAAFDLGAPAERIGATGGGIILPMGLAPFMINDTLLALSTKVVIEDNPIPSDHPEQKDRPMQSAALSSTHQITATPQEMILAPGFYAVTVTRGGGQRLLPGHMPLPAIQVATPPASEAAQVEILASHGGGWLTRQGDTVLLKVNGESTVLLTSYKNSLSPEDSLEIQFSRVDGASVTTSAASNLPKITIVAHVQNQGDQTFPGGAWAGMIGQGLCIEGFGIVAEEGITDEEINYRAVAANGWETPWYAGKTLCGSRGQGIPLIGVGVRLIGAAAERYECLCEATFVGGTRSGVSRGGAICRSDVIGAPLEGFLVTFVPKV